MFLGGKERRFTDDESLSRTFVGFHGHYDSSGKLNRQLVEKFKLFDWIVKYSDGKADQDLVRRWISIERNTGMVAFMHPDTVTFGSNKTFVCEGDEPGRPGSCPTIPVSALALGIVTDLQIRRSPDK